MHNKKAIRMNRILYAKRTCGVSESGFLISLVIDLQKPFASLTHQVRFQPKTFFLDIS